MQFLAKASSLFVGLRAGTSYHQALQVPDLRKDALLAARRDIREAIREAAPRLRSENRLWEASFASLRDSSPQRIVEPKFSTQGSFAYNLLVDPHSPPRQQIDLDDGLYVLVEFLRDGRPALVAAALFSAVEDALRPLCARRGWKLISDKDTCVRVQVAPDAHVDITIYSAPRDVFRSERLAKASALAENRRRVTDSQAYGRIPSDKIMLARRCGDWQSSDPLKLQDWVDGCVERYGEDFRRACRYLKGWRDYRWEGPCSLSSITIMAAVAEGLERMRGAHRSYDDDRLVYEISLLMPDIFGGDLFNPAFPGEGVLLNDWSDEDRQEICAAAKGLASDMTTALVHTADQTRVVDTLRRAFGARIPYRPDAVEILPKVAATVAAVAPTIVKAPKVTNSTSG